MISAGMTDVGAGQANSDMHGLFCLVIGIVRLMLLLGWHWVSDINPLLLVRHGLIAGILALLVLVDRHSLHVCPT